ncbi:tetratricopeptide repeat protein [Eubacteriaceae bacterium ES3]|nr:tetratricopeptide repeat protein [Eubacteriaceae bacterium ES3]
MNEYENQKEQLKAVIRKFSHEGNYVEAIPYMETYCDLIREHFGADSDRYVTVINDLGGMYRNVGDFEKSHETFDKALKLIEKKVGKDSMQYATTSVNLACMYRLTKEFDKAERMFLEALKSYDNDREMKDILSADTISISPENLEFKSTLYANATNNLANLYQDMGKMAEAKVFLSKSLELLKNTGNHEYIAISNLNLANALMVEGELDEALSMIESSLLIFDEHLGKDHPLYLTSLNNLAAIYFHQKKYDKALEMLNNVEPLLKATYSENSPQYQSLVLNIKEVEGKLE